MSIEASIVEWALTRPGWQQDVLVAASKGEQLDEQGVVELADTIVAGTAAAPTNEAKAIELRPPATPPSRSGSRRSRRRRASTPSSKVRPSTSA